MLTPVSQSVKALGFWSAVLATVLRITKLVPSKFLTVTGDDTYVP
ncbi:MAG: hypothetical protein O2909_01780 [Chloroflexi bacterium]|nr:hypothetical protein [Chloroflexota bacterium]MDA1218158.1 hypothetical protein [Chloroflexota bacterium]